MKPTGILTTQFKPEWDTSATRSIIAAVGVMLGIGNLDHGIFEILQGNKPIRVILFNPSDPRTGFGFTAPRMPLP